MTIEEARKLLGKLLEITWEDPRVPGGTRTVGFLVGVGDYLMVDDGHGIPHENVRNLQVIEPSPYESHIFCPGLSEPCGTWIPLVDAADHVLGNRLLCSNCLTRSTRGYPTTRQV